MGGRTKRHADQLTPSDRDFELKKLEIRSRVRRWDLVFQVLRDFIRVLPWMLGAIVVLLCTYAVAGKTTTFVGFLKLIVDMKLHELAPYLLATAATTAWVIERKRHQKTIAQGGEYARQLEARIDPARSSSKLLPSGQPRKEDRE